MENYGNSKAGEKDCCKRAPGMDIESNLKMGSSHMSEENMAGSLGDANAAALKTGYTGGGKAGDPALGGMNPLGDYA